MSKLAAPHSWEFISISPRPEPTSLRSASNALREAEGEYRSAPFPIDVRLGRAVSVPGNEVEIIIHG